MVDKRAERGVPSLVWRAGQERRLAMLNAAAPLEGRRVLVDGCGIGLYVRAIRRFTPHVFGIDIEPTYLVQGRCAGVTELVQAACEQLPFPEATFDVVLSNEVLEHVHDDRAAAREIARVLRPGGRAVIFAPNRWYPFETHGVYWRGRYYFGNKPLVNWLPSVVRNRLAPHVRAYTAAQLLQLFADTPLQLVSLRGVYPALDNVIARRRVLGQSLRALFDALERSPLHRFGISHLLVLEKVT